MVFAIHRGGYAPTFAPLRLDPRFEDSRAVRRSTPLRTPCDGIGHAAFLGEDAGLLRRRRRADTCQHFHHNCVAKDTDRSSPGSKTHHGDTPHPIKTAEDGRPSGWSKTNFNWICGRATCLHRLCCSRTRGDADVSCDCTSPDSGGKGVVFSDSSSHPFQEPLYESPTHHYRRLYWS